MWLVNITGEDGERRLSLFVHIWTSFISGLPVSMTYGGDSQQCSHLCEAYWRRLRSLLGLPLNIAPKCVSLAHQEEGLEVRLLLLLLIPVHQCGGAGGGAHGRWAECSGALAATLVFLLWLTGGLREMAYV